ncbi:MAG: hypothetical protein P4L91_01565 [Burkholderiaceae bacterium]|nr:hypothetical protein [Burkholderiaceae bacterium]
MNAEFNTSLPYLTDRDKNAPKLDSAFTQFGQSVTRQDCPSWIQPYPNLPSVDSKTKSDIIPYSDGALTTWVPPA